MQSYLYRNNERIKSVFSQYLKELPTKKSSEKNRAIDASISGNFLSFFKASTKGTSGKKTVVESIETVENMIATLLNDNSKNGFITQISNQTDWEKIKQGDLIVFKGDMKFDSFGLTKEELWEASYDEIGERKIRHDLRLKGKVINKIVEIPFSSKYVTGPSQFTVLCHAMFDHLDCIAIVIGSPQKEPIMMQPLAFGNGFYNE